MHANERARTESVTRFHGSSCAGRVTAHKVIDDGLPAHTRLGRPMYHLVAEDKQL